MAYIICSNHKLPALSITKQMTQMLKLREKATSWHGRYSPSFVFGMLVLIAKSASSMHFESAYIQTDSI